MTHAIPAEGWHVEIDHPTFDHTFTPDVVGDPQRLPRVNGYPRIRIPVRRRDRWRELVDEYPDTAIPLRVWYDGDQAPIEELETVEETESRSILKARGGIQLENRAQRSVQQAEKHKLAEDIIANETPYDANVDEPPTDITENETLLSADSESEWQDAIPAYPFDDDDPRYITTGGALDTHQTGYFAEGEDGDVGVSGAWSTLLDTRWSGGAARGTASVNQSINFDFNIEYRIPQEYAFVDVRIGYLDDTHPSFSVSLDGEELYSEPADGDPFGAGITAPEWLNLTFSGAQPSSDLSGSHTLTVSTGDTQASDESDIFVDCVAIYDSRYTDNIPSDTSPNSDDLLEWPGLYPNSISTETDNITTIQQVTGGRLESVWGSTTNNQSIALSNDGGSTFEITGSNTNAIEGDFSSKSVQLLGRFTQSRHDSGSGPVVYDASQPVDSFTLQADLSNVPLVINQTYDGSVESILKQLADPEYVWAVQRQADGSLAVEWTQPGQRTRDTNVDVSSYSDEISKEPVVHIAVVKGKSIPVRSEEFFANHGTPIGLQQLNLQRGREAVYDPDTDEQFDYGVDYELNWQTGEITTLANGSMVDGDPYEIDYQYRPVGRESLDTLPADATVRVFEFPSLTTERACRQVALQLLGELDEPLIEATAELAGDDIGWAVVEALSLDDLPKDQPYEVDNIEHTPTGTRLSLESRQSINEAVSSIRTQIEQVSSEL